MKNYEKLRSAYLEHYIAELTKEHPKVFQPDVFYESHTDYLPLTIDYSVLEDYYRDLRDCVKDHPKLIYLLLAAVCPLFQIFGCANYSFIFYFRSNDETLNWFISRLVSSMYGMPESSDHDEKIDFSKMSKVSHCHKAYYLNEIPYNSFNEHDDLRFLDDSYLTRTNNLYGKKYSGNTLIRTFSDPDEFFRYYDDTFGHRMYFNTDLLSDAFESDSAKYYSLKKFIMHCKLKNYHHVFNPKNKSMYRKFLSKRYIHNHNDTSLNFIAPHAHLTSLAEIIFMAAAFLEDKLRITIPKESITQIILRNFDFSIRTFLSYKANDLLRSYYPSIRLLNRPANSTLSTWPRKLSTYSIDRDLDIFDKISFNGFECEKVYPNPENFEIGTMEYGHSFEEFFRNYLKSNKLYTKTCIKKYFDASGQEIDISPSTSPNNFHTKNFYLYDVYSYDTDITSDLDDIIILYQ